MELDRKCHYWLEFGSNLEILWKKHTFFSEKMCFLIEFAIFGYLRAIFDPWRPTNHTKSIGSIDFVKMKYI